MRLETAAGKAGLRLACGQRIGAVFLKPFVGVKKEILLAHSIPAYDWRSRLAASCCRRDREDRYRRSPARSSPDSPLDQPGSNWALVRVGRNSAQITETSRFLTTAVPLSNQVGWVPVSAFAFKAAFVAPSLHVAVTGLTKVIIRRFVGTFAVVTNSHPRGSLRPGLDLSCRGQRGWWHRLPAYARDQSYPLP